MLENVRTMPIEELKIKWCFIQHPTPENGLYQAIVRAGFTDNADEQATQIFSYYPDEISFQAKEFLGLTSKEALALFLERDMAYLQS